MCVSSRGPRGEAAALESFVRGLIVSRPHAGSDDEWLTDSGFYDEREAQGWFDGAYAGWAEDPSSVHRVWEDSGGWATILDGLPAYRPWAGAASDGSRRESRRVAQRERRGQDGETCNQRYGSDVPATKGTVRHVPATEGTV